MTKILRIHSPFTLLGFIAGLALPCSAAQTALSGNSSGTFRWLDAAGNAYSKAYQTSYSYDSASVTVDYQAGASGLSGSLNASNLKPNFAYQFKLTGNPGTEGSGNENLGTTGRWWHEEWDGSQWTNGSNAPNDKGDGSYPNPNDENWLDKRDISDPSSPTGKKYKFTGYRLFEYFFSDEFGNASLDFTVDSSYHVLWKTTQSWPYSAANDGPIKSRSFNPDPLVHTAYDSDYGESAVSVYGEWERLPQGDIGLPEGLYNVGFELTEESFHGVDGTDSGSWALAMSGTTSFSIPEPGSSLLLLFLATVLLRRRP